MKLAFLPSGVFRSYLMMLSFAVSWFASEAQKLEPEINLQGGFASIYCGNLKDYYSFLKKQDSDVVTSNAHSNLGGYIGIGGRLIYPASPKIGIIGELNFSYRSSKIFSNYRTQDIDATVSGTKERVSSEASVQFFSVSIPLLVRYKFLESKNFHVISGFTFNYNFPPNLKSKEEHILTTYQNGVITSSDLEKANQNVTLNKFNPVNVFFTLGIEKKLKRNLKNWTIGIRGNYSITKTEMYTNNTEFLNSSFNNVVFSNMGKNLIEAFSGVKLNNYRMGAYFFTISYHPVAKAKKKKEEK